MTMMMIAEAMGRALDPAPPACCRLATGRGNKGATNPTRAPGAARLGGKTRADGSFRGLPRADISNPSSRLGYVLDLMATLGFFVVLGLRMTRDGGRA